MGPSRFLHLLDRPSAKRDTLDIPATKFAKSGGSHTIIISVALDLLRSARLNDLPPISPIMSKSAVASVERQIAEQELSRARQTLVHLVEMYNSGQWRQHYQESAFVDVVRQARLAFDHWTEVCDRVSD